MPSAYTATHIGRLRHRVTIQHMTTQPSELDGTPGAWDTLATVYADVQAVRGSESETAVQKVALRGYTVIIRCRDDVTPGMRIVARGKTLNVVSVNNLEERDIWTVLDCTELVNV